MALPGNNDKGKKGKGNTNQAANNNSKFITKNLSGKTSAVGGGQKKTIKTGGTRGS